MKLHFIEGNAEKTKCNAIKVGSFFFKSLNLQGVE